MKMQCFVPFCKYTSDNLYTSEVERNSISFHAFPSEAHLHAAWLRALGKQDSHLPDSAVVCSQHFLNDDIYETECGLRQIKTGAIPSTVKVCMICLDTDSKLILMSKHKLDDVYEKLTGYPLCDVGNLKHTVCVQCAQRLMNFNKFRDKSLRARALMMDLVEKHKLITKRHIKMINRTKHQLKSNMVLTTLGADHCDLHILEHPSQDKQTELEETEHRIVVKTEERDDSMLADGYLEVILEEDNNANDFVRDPLKNENSPFQCTLCVEQFVHEHEYMRHMRVHLQNGEGDGECDTSQVCEPHTAVSSSSSHSSLITENKQADPGPAARASHTSVALPPASLLTNNKIEVLATEEVDTSISCQYNKLTDCFTKLYDSLAKKVVQREDGSLMKTRRDGMSCDSLNTVCKGFRHHATIQNEVPTTANNCSSVKVVSNNLHSNCSNNVINIQCINSSLSSLHTEKISLICDICRKHFNRKSLLVKHIKTHSERQSTYRMRTHTVDKSYTCEICNCNLAHSSSLVAHMRTHTGEKPFTCKICYRKFTQNSSLVRHMKTHTSGKPFVCEICNKEFARNSHLDIHMITHTGEKPFSCEICEYKTASKSSLKDHTRTHTGEKPFTCQFCNIKFALNSNLVRHISTHTGQKPYFCTLCSYKCTLNSSLVKHMRTHTGNKPFSCKLCVYKTANKCNLVRHMKTHTGEKPYSCNMCEYKCADRYRLKNHMITHSGEKSFSCQLCEYKYASKQGLVSHMTSHIGEKSV